MDKLLEILREHRDKVSYTITFSNPAVLTLIFKDGSTLILHEHRYYENIQNRTQKSS